ncbi:MAG: RCC1 repeat-containing protein [Planctomycetia bacterium]|nr:RCC1 repeat-containing protein [Planctomycetia bacterium]
MRLKILTVLRVSMVASVVCGLMFFTQYTAGSYDGYAIGSTTGSLPDDGGSTPTATTGSATCVSLSSVLLNGWVNGNGLATTAWFDYGTSTGMYFDATTTIPCGTGSTYVNATLGDLTPWTTYYCRIASQNIGGIYYGSETTFMPRTQISAGAYHTLTLKPDGTVWAYGANWNSQLGDGSTTDSSTPVQVSGLTDAIAIAGGVYHTIALKSDGTVWTWGWNNSGQLGDGTTINRSTPVQVIGLTDVIAIAGGDYHTIALKSDGTVWTWGFNYYGQLGGGATTNRSTPVQVKGLADIIAIAGGYVHSIALKSDGTVWAWGYNGYGQLGDGSTTDHLTPVQVSGLTDIIAIAGGYIHTIALKSDGTVWAWGHNEGGQLGDGTTTNSSTPVQVSGLTDVIAVTARLYHTIALKSDGTVWTWGRNIYGQLGDGSTTERSLPVQVIGLTDVIAIAGGYYHTIALKSDGAVWAWGYNGNNQLGNWSTKNSSTPVRSLRYDMNSVTTPAVITGSTTCVSLSSVLLNGWVDGNRAATTAWFDYGTSSGVYFDTTATIPCGTSSAYVSATLGSLTPWTTYYYRIAAQNSRGISYGSETIFLPRSQISAGAYHTLTLKPDGTVWACGANWNGQLGDGTTINRSTPVQVSGLTDVIAIAGGDYHTIALKSDNTVWAWGSNSYGQLGDVSTANSLTPAQCLLSPIVSTGTAINIGTTMVRSTPTARLP